MGEGNSEPPRVLHVASSPEYRPLQRVTISSMALRAILSGQEGGCVGSLLHLGLLSSHEYSENCAIYECLVPFKEQMGTLRAR